MDDISDHVSVDFATCRAGRSLPQCFGVVQLCQVYDSAEFCRNVHANPEWQRQAVEAIMLTASKHLMHTSSYTALRQPHQDLMDDTRAFAPPARRVHPGAQYAPRTVQCSCAVFAAL